MYPLTIDHHVVPTGDQIIMPTYRPELIALNPEHSLTAQRRWDTTSAAAALLKVL